MLVNDVAGADVAELCRLFSRWSCLDVSSDFGKQPGIQEDDKPTQGVEDNKNVLKDILCNVFNVLVTMSSHRLRIIGG